MTADAAPTPPAGGPLLVFADDWGRHPSSCQHLVRRLLPRHRVGWVNTIGMRPPRLDAATLRRGLSKLGRWSRPAADDSGRRANLDVLEPRMWPRYRRGWERSLNRRLLASQLRRWIDAAGGPVTAVTTLPITADLAGRLPVARWVYYCVDDFSVWPGLDGGPLREMEREVVRRADILIAAGRSLRDRLAAMRPDAPVALLTHGADLGFWAEAAADADAMRFERPVVLFWGLIDRRTDVAWLRRLSDDLDRGTILLAGPEENPDPALWSVPRVTRFGAVSPDRLPALAAAADVLAMPYADLPVTRAMQPLKLLEYLATGKPAIVRDLPACRDWADAADLADSPEAFSALVRERLATGLPPSQAAARDRRLPAESWDAKAAAFERLVFGPEAGQ